MIVRIPFTDILIEGPLRAGEDGEIVDAQGNCVCVVDYNREKPDEEAQAIANWLANVANAGMKVGTDLRAVL